MEREYDLFEQHPDGSVSWRGHVVGLKDTTDRLQQLAKTTPNLCYAMHLPTQEVVARANMPPQAPGTKAVVFQISYDLAHAAERAAILRKCGYDVVTVMSSAAAKAVLSSRPECQLFVVGHNAPKEDRAELVSWLKRRFPGTRVLALNPPDAPELPGADFNTEINGPESWLPLILKALGAS